MVGDFEVGDEAIAVKHIARPVGHGQFAPVDFEGVSPLGQGDLVGVTISVIFPRGAVLDPQVDPVQAVAWLEKVDPVVERGVRFGFAGENEMEVVQPGLPAKGWWA